MNWCRLTSNEMVHFVILCFIAHCHFPFVPLPMQIICPSELTFLFASISEYLLYIYNMTFCSLICTEISSLDQYLFIALTYGTLCRGKRR